LHPKNEGARHSERAPDFYSSAKKKGGKRTAASLLVRRATGRFLFPAPILPGPVHLETAKNRVKASSTFWLSGHGLDLHVKHAQAQLKARKREQPSFIRIYLLCEQ
jgi:hypothetical protein